LGRDTRSKAYISEKRKRYFWAEGVDKGNQIEGIEEIGLKNIGAAMD
jgi:hypothetical protein